jgi:hypothetical protein
VESALHSLPKSSDTGNDDGVIRTWLNWRKNWVGFGRGASKVTVAGAPTCPSPGSVKAPQSEIQRIQFKRLEML